MDEGCCWCEERCTGDVWVDGLRLFVRLQFSLMLYHEKLIGATIFLFCRPSCPPVSSLLFPPTYGSFVDPDNQDIPLRRPFIPPTLHYISNILWTVSGVDAVRLQNRVRGEWVAHGLSCDDLIWVASMVRNCSLRATLHLLADEDVRERTRSSDVHLRMNGL